MVLSAPQSRAGRALLDWSQEKLAQSAGVARATIVDFERGGRIPVRNNLVAIKNTLESAGIEFIAENGGGAGARFRKIELEFNPNIGADSDGITLRVRYRSQPYRIRIPSEIIEDLNGTTYDTAEQLKTAVQNHLGVYLRTIERMILSNATPPDGNILLQHDMFEAGTF